MIIQLNPTIPMSCPHGKGRAIALLDYSEEHDIIWVIAIDATGEIWSHRNPEVRMLTNITMGREYVDKITEKQHRPVEHNQQESEVTKSINLWKEYWGDDKFREIFKGIQPDSPCYGKLKEDG